MTKLDISQQRLFRLESLQARALEWQGRPVLALGRPVAFTTLTCVVLVAAMAALITFGSYTRRVDIEGTILPSSGLVAISSPSSGWIAALAVQEGQAVEKGAWLYILDLDTATKDGDTQRQIINAQTTA